MPLMTKKKPGPGFLLLCLSLRGAGGGGRGGNHDAMGALGSLGGPGQLAGRWQAAASAASQKGGGTAS